MKKVFSKRALVVHDVHYQSAVAGAIGAAVFAAILGVALAVAHAPLLGQVGNESLPIDGQQFYDPTYQFKDAKRQLKQIKSEVKRLARDIKGTPALAAAESFVKQYEADIAHLEAASKSLDQNDPDAQQDFQFEIQEKLSTQTFYDEFMPDLNELANSARQLKESKRWIKDAERNLKQMTQECKRTKCKGSEAESTLDEYKGLLAQMKDAVQQGDAETANEVNGDLGTVQQNFWDAMQETYLREDMKNLNRTKKDMDRMLKEAQREATKGTKGAIDATTLEEIEKGVREFDELADAAGTALDGGNIDDARDAKDDAFAIAEDLRDLFEPLHDRRGDDDGPGDMNQILDDITIAEKNITTALASGKTSKEIASTCRDLLKRGREIVLAYMEADKGGDEGTMDNLMEKLQSIGDQVDQNCSDFMPPED